VSNTEEEAKLYNKDNRRGDGTRRAVKESVNDDQRKNDDRRLDDDRRGFYVNLLSDDEGFFDAVIAWLMDNGDEKWTIGPNDNEPEGSVVTCRVRFESAEMLRGFETWLDQIEVSAG
jgi:hypothetical protein